MSAGDQWGAPGGGEYGGPPKSGAITAIAVLAFVLGGLGLICGVVGVLGGGFFAAAGSKLQQAGVAEAGTATAIGGLIVIQSLLMLATAILAIPAGIGLLQRRKWGRTLTLVSAGTGIATALLTWIWGIVGILMIALILTYAIMAFVVLLNARNASQFT